jgi:hypothetical protein
MSRFPQRLHPRGLELPTPKMWVPISWRCIDCPLLHLLYLRYISVDRSAKKVAHNFIIQDNQLLSQNWKQGYQELQAYSTYSTLSFTKLPHSQ